MAPPSLWWILLLEVCVCVCDVEGCVEVRTTRHYDRHDTDDDDETTTTTTTTTRRRRRRRDDDDDDDDDETTTTTMTTTTGELSQIYKSSAEKTRTNLSTTSSADNALVRQHRSGHDSFPKVNDF